MPVERTVHDHALKRWTVTATAVIDAETGAELRDCVVGPQMGLAEIEQRIRDIAALSARVAALGDQMQALGLFASAVRMFEAFSTITDARDALRAARLELLAAQAPER